MAEVLKVSNSRIKLWRRCRRAHHYKYNEKIERIKPPIALLRGKILHEAISALIHGKSWENVLDGYIEKYDKLFVEEKEIYGNLPEDLYILMEGYVRRWGKEDLEYLELDGKKTEFEFSVELLPGIMLTGYIDAVVRDRQKRIWIVEHKSHKKIPTDQVRLTDLQTTYYTWVLPRIGLPKPDGVLWDYIRTKAPAWPETLGNGTLTRRKNLDTDYHTYLEAIEELGQDPDDYQEVLDRLKGNTDKFYRRVYFPAPRTTQRQLIRELKETSLEIKHLGGISKARTITPLCGSCSYYSLCQAELRGLDSDFIRKAEYQERRRDDNGREAEEIEDGGSE